MGIRTRIRSRTPSVGGGGTTPCPPDPADLFFDVGRVTAQMDILRWKPFLPGNTDATRGRFGVNNIQGETQLRYKNTIENVGTVNIGGEDTLRWKPFIPETVGVVGIQGDTTARYNKIIQSVGTVNVGSETVLRWKPLAIQTGTVNIDAEFASLNGIDVLGLTSAINIGGDTVLRYNPLRALFGAIAIASETVFRAKPFVLRTGDVVVGGDTVLRWNPFKPLVNPVFGTINVAGDSILRFNKIIEPVGAVGVVGASHRLAVLFLYGTTTNDVSTNWNSDANATGKPDNTTADDAIGTNTSGELQVSITTLTSITGWTWIPSLTRIFLSGATDADALGTYTYQIKAGAAATARATFAVPLAGAAVDNQDTNASIWCPLLDTNNATAETARTDVDGVAATLTGLNDLINGGYVSMRHATGAAVAGRAHFDGAVWMIVLRDSNLSAPTISRELANSGGTSLAYTLITGSLPTTASRRLANGSTTAASKVNTTTLQHTGSFEAFFRTGTTRPAAGTNTVQFRWWAAANNSENSSYRLDITYGTGAANDAVELDVIDSGGGVNVLKTVTGAGLGMTPNGTQDKVSDLWWLSWLADERTGGRLTIRRLSGAGTWTSIFADEPGDASKRGTPAAATGFFGFSWLESSTASVEWFDDIFLVLF